LARKILLADDSVTAQNMGRKILADAGYEVSTVNNGSAALKRVAETRPDLIVLDVYMPGYSGLEVCSRLKEASETARIPVLLTVGKLEPFKPEEAKRARADAFIVKPFEASELLAALSRLEDKIVPRSEPSKPGRFARAIAAVEEGRYDQSVARDEDSGWKERISFPSKKKKSKAEVEEERVDDPALYNPVNKDLRTVVERKAAPAPAPASPDDTRVDLAALSFQGLPQDVTPQEIAALAAAAARIQGTTGEKQEGDGRASEKQPAEVPAPEAKAAEAVPEPQAVAQPPVPAEDKAADKADKKEDKIEVKPEPTEISKEAAAPVAESAPEQKAEQTEKVEAPAEKPIESVVPFIAPGLTSSIDPDLTGAIAAMPLGTYVSLSPSSGNGSSAPAPEPEPEPVTMAAATGAEFSASASRWMAVPVALLPEEAALSLELEMQKAHAAFAAAEAAQAAPVQVVPEVPVALVEPAPAIEISAPVQAAAIEPAVPQDAPPAPSLMQTISAVASEAKQAIRAAVKEFESVAASFVEEKSSPPAEPEPTPVVPAEAALEPAPVAAAPVEAKPEPIPVVEEAKAVAAPEVAPAPEAVPALEASQTVSQERTEQKREETEPVAEGVAGAPAQVSPGAEIPETVAPAVSEAPAEPASAKQDSPQVAEAAAQTEPDAGGIDDMAKKEKEIADNTAAAWASWRRIRESDAKGPPSEAEDKALPEDRAAMAVAAGAERAPEEVPAEGESGESEDIASIVDSVLADMRPKIVQEISKKLGKKKK